MQPYTPQFTYPYASPYQVPQYQAPQPVMPAPQPVVKPMGITGRVVGSTDDIAVQDVPTDGTVAWFPMQDGSAVVGKRWTPDGNIATTRFVPEAPGQQARPVDPFEAINERIDGLTALIEDLADGIQRQADPKRPAAAKRRMVKSDAE